MLEQVQRYTFMRQCVVLGRGFNYATAFEWSLKIKRADLYHCRTIFFGGFSTWTDRNGGTKFPDSGRGTERKDF